jgi:hypothetical protein
MNVAASATKPPSAHIDDDSVEVIPLELRAAKCWIVWRWIWKPDLKNPKWDKPPIDPATGVQVDATDKSNHLDFDEARQVARLHGDGVGIALGSKADRFGVVGIDLDRCIDPSNGRIDPDALKIVREFQSYTEVTVSGTGLRVLIWGTKPGPRCRTSKRPGIEIYESDRYFTVSGRHFEGTPTVLARRQDALDALYHEVFGAVTPPHHAGNGQSNGSIPLVDDELIELARRAKNGTKFSALLDRGDVSDYAGDDSAADLALCNLLAYWTGRDYHRIEALFNQSALGQRDKWKNRPDYRQRTIDRAIDDCKEVYNPTPKRKQPKTAVPIPSANNQNLPEILVTCEEFKVNDQAIAALCIDQDLYQRNLKLVTIAWDEKARGTGDLRRAEGTPIIRPVLAARLREDLTRVAQWKKLKHIRDDEYEKVPIHPPEWSVAAILAREHWPNIRHLVGIVEAPTLRSDGSVIDQPGFDQATGLLYAPNGSFPPIPPRPTREDARNAAAMLLDLVSDFPFKKGHNAAWLAALLTAMFRLLVNGPVPLFLFEANTSGAGKTLLCDLIAGIVTGRSMTRTGYTHDPIELDKQLTATALAGDQLVLFDNLQNGARFGNPALDRALTGRTWRGRILGKSEMTPPLDLITVFFASGNNTALCGDVARRIVHCRLESLEERPEERTGFKIPDLPGYAATNRGDLVKAALTILRAYILAGKPDQKLRPMDFTAWSGLIRYAVHWSTGLDPCADRSDLVNANPELGHAAGLVEAWYEMQTTKNVKGFTVAEVLRELKSDSADIYRSLRDALGELCSRTKPGELPSSGTIGMKIQAIRGQVFGGKRFVVVGDEKRAKIWGVEDVSTVGESSEPSESFPIPRAENGNNKHKTHDLRSGSHSGEKTHQSHQTHPDCGRNGSHSPATSRGPSESSDQTPKCDPALAAQVRDDIRRVFGPFEGDDWTKYP